jgi:hypothetical protein
VAAEKIIVKLGAKVITIEPAQNALSMEEVVKLLSAAFEQACALKEVQPVTLRRIWEHAYALPVCKRISNVPSVARIW